MKGKVLFYVKINDLNLLNDVSFYEQDIRVLRDMGYDVKLTNKYRDVFFENYDFVFIWWWSYALLPVLWAKLTSRKSIIAGAFHYSTPLMSGTDYLRRSPLYKILVRLALIFSDANIFVSRHEYSNVVDNIYVKNPYMVYHGIDLDKYHFPSVCKKREVNDGNPIIDVLIISWLEKNNIERKCVLQSIKAVCRAFKNNYSIRLKIAGRPGPGYNEFLVSLREIEGSECIEILGHISEKEKLSLLKSSEIFMSPTLYEGFGVAIAEALACGCAVITSPNGAVLEVAGDCAVYCDPLSVDSIYEKLIFLLDDPAFTKQISRCGAERIKAKFSYQHHSESLSNVILKTF